MATVKTAISLDETLFEKLELIAAALQMSRSGLLSTALLEYIERYENRQLLDAINAAYEDEGQEEEIELSARHRRKVRKLDEGSW